MPEVDVMIGGRLYRLGCGEGEEEQLASLARRIDGEAQRLISSMGAVSEGRLMVMCALMVADKLMDAEKRLAARPPDTERAEVGARLDALAGRLETLVTRLSG